MVLTCIHTQCFGAKVRKIGIPLHTPVFFFYTKVGVKGGYLLLVHVFLMQTLPFYERFAALYLSGKLDSPKVSLNISISVYLFV